MSLLLPLLTLFLLPAPVDAILRLKLQHWFPGDSAYWINAASNCEAEITSYLINNRTTACQTPCACAADCILDGIPGTLQSNYASAQVVLGLVPAVLLLIGPSIAEVAVISTRRPLLAVLIALGCPTSYLGRIFQHVDMRELMHRTDRNIIGTTLAKHLADQVHSATPDLDTGNTTCVDTSATEKKHHHRVLNRAMDLAMYVLALLAIVNGVQISIYTDFRTISGWRCGALFMPMVWFLMSVVEHGWGMIAVRVLLWSHREHAGTRSKKNVTNTLIGPPDPHVSATHVGVPHILSPSQAKPGSHAKSSITQRLQSQLRSSISSNLYTCLPGAQPTLWSEFLFWIAQASALVHMIFGIFELSSLVFISALESVQVFARFAVSVVLCQIVVQIELAMMRAELQHQNVHSPSASSAASSPEVVVRDSQGGSGGRTSLANVVGNVGSIRSQGSVGTNSGSVQVAGSIARASGSTNAS